MKVSSSLLAIGIMTLVGAASFTSCRSDAEWTIKGVVADYNPDEAIVVEGSDNGRWYLLDTLNVSKNGKFKYSQSAAGYPDIYRLRMGSASLYFPIDSIETVTVNTSAGKFGTDFTLDGTPTAERMMHVDKKILEAVNSVGSDNAVSPSLKRELATTLLADPADIVSYYLICKKIGDVPLFSPSDKDDLKVIGAVANAFDKFRPSDPRTGYLRRLYLSYRQQSSTPNVVEANEIRAFEIDLYDQKGVRHSLLEETSKGNVVILNFTAYSAQESPAFNIALNEVYQKFHQKGLEIFQVALDDNEHLWKQTAANLPWITVLNSVADNGKTLREYNVMTLPTTFIFNRNGELVSRVDDIANLQTAVTPYL